jgi:glucuronokinase
MIIESRAYARAGLLGNPSDGYFGKTISISVRNFGAHVTLYESPELRIEPQQQDTNIYKNIYDLVESVALHGYYGGDRLIKAAIKKFFEYCQSNNIRFENRNFSIRYHSTIPRQVGLAGSSAIITATMRALMKFYTVDIPNEILPSVILSAERDELGISAGLQDRVIQVYEGCVYMDFNKEIIKKKNHGIYERIDTNLLPNLYIAYNIELGKESGRVLSDVRIRYEKGEKLVVESLARIAQIAQEGKKAILEGNINRLADLINENFDLRSKIMNINEQNRRMVETARKCGASAKFAGSGGSIIGIYRDTEMLDHLIIELKRVNARVIKPFII